jgi:hypothetical protein
LGETFERMGNPNRARAIYVECIASGDWKFLIGAQEGRRLAEHLHGLNLLENGGMRTPSDYLALAYAHLRQRAAAEAISAFEQALKDPQIWNDLEAGNLYNAACAAALAGGSASVTDAAPLTGRALSWLEHDLGLRLETLKRGLGASPSADLEWHLRRAWRAHFDLVRSGNPDLNSLRRLPRFAELIRSISARAPP